MIMKRLRKHAVLTSEVSRRDITFNTNQEEEVRKKGKKDNTP